jgi:SNF family Na+-dependent transporter
MFVFHLGLYIPKHNKGHQVIGKGRSFIIAFLYNKIKSLYKVAYVTAIFPYVVLFVLLVTGCTLEGAKNGVNYYITPDWKKLADISVGQNYKK